MLFKVLDYNNNPVILSKDTWHKKLLHPIFGHPEVKQFRIQIKNTIQNPDFIYQSIRDTRSKLFITKINKGIYASYFLTVVIKYVKDKEYVVGYVATAMINRKLPTTSKLLWERKALI